jgi:hypothetical protein
MCQFADELAAVGIPLYNRLAPGSNRHKILLKTKHEGSKYIVKNVICPEALQHIEVSRRGSRYNCKSGPVKQM